MTVSEGVEQTGEIVVGRDPRLWNEDLAPTPVSARTWGTYAFAALWIGMAHCIPTYQMASGLVVQGMDWKQALFTIALGNLIVLIPMLLNSHGGTRYGLPFPVLCRASFGVRGANLPALLRAIVACGWFGIQTWIGGEALNGLLSSTLPWWNSVPANIWICFGAFWALNVAIIWKGMDAVRWFEGWAAPMVLVVAVVLLVYMIKRANGLGPVLDEPSKFTDTADFLRHLPIFLTAQIGFWATLSLNMPDFTRYSKNQSSQMWGQILGLPTTMTFFSAIGVLITSATAVVYGTKIDDPIKLLSKPEFANPVVVLLSLVSIGVATLSVNVAANVVSPAFDLANIWPEKIDFKVGGTITALVGILMMPWKIMASAGNYIFTWLVGYSALLGPIAGVMVADYWILRRTRLHVAELYEMDGMYRYSNGVNWLAVTSLIVGILPNLPGFILEATGRKPETGFEHVAADIYAFAWIVGFVVSMVLYSVLMLTLQRENVEADRALEA
ncbi:MAG: nitrate reductase [Proteobacteria bacterium]|nr:nitrate reductase [Pseudomonadota bacterium]